MRDHDHGLAARLPDAQQLAPHAVARQGVQRAERLVQEQQIGVLNQRPGNGHPLRHAPR